ncbi:alanine--tRNA ligase [Tepidibacter formicigenes]|uniref:Alanine--tRNA ligase n=1 Tax=Tepidibacter formicigenes DSM 15518 TaxID=1123349 RepID=A0A1M6PCA2_9FIRM|nr:alanine--tRNA ligase [Tepidibacter formicigenes]SHK05547.1 alanyl-tRNA synthetase [Tepidibacter formicigenes DSM 15518]
MKKLGLNEIRSRFLEFFESKGHLAKGSFPLVPQNDPSLLLINAGMAPLKNYFMGKEVPPNKRMATCQKCIRTGDIENVGKTARHATLFEMLGNFSFGDYFKRESIKWGWEFVTKHLEIPEEKVWVSIYENDDEAFEIWNKEVGFPAQRIVRLGKEDNFWEIGTGPCGPCSELYYDRGEKYGCNSPDCKPGCDCDRYIEFWNHVFTQFDKDEDGNYNPLPNPNIDTGMGLERIACIMQDVDNIFEIDTIKHILNGVLEITNVEYGKNEKTDTSIRIITDHIRAVTFLVADGVLPSNEGRGYVLRRLLRRAARHGKLLGIKEGFLYKLMDKVVEVSGDAYPELIEKKDYIRKVLKIEEERFEETIDQGMEILKGYINKLKENNKKVLSGENAFKLYDTYGFPIDLTKEILEEEGFKVDEKSFEEEMEKQRNRARSARQNDESDGWKEDIFSKIDQSIKSEFVGYYSLEEKSTISAIVKGDEIVNEAHNGEKVTIILDKTPFYAESGGQVGDKGILFNESFDGDVIDTKKGLNDRIHHEVVVKKGSIHVKDEVNAKVEKELRMNSARNHSATHLLHKALKEILGDHVQQAGSLVTPQRLRFDFTHFEAISKEELLKIEMIVNKKVMESLDIDANEMSIDEAKKMGATALFGEKYGDVVRVVAMGDYSCELCGGTHLKNTSQIGLFKIISESGVAAGVRRIEAITGMSVYEYISEKENKILNICNTLKTKEDNVISKAKSLVDEVRELNKELDSIKNKVAMASVDDAVIKKEVKGVNLILAKFEGMDMNSLRNIGDNLKDKYESGVIVLANTANDKVNFIVTATKDVVEKGVHCGNIIREVAKIAGGNGGGRPDMAQAGGKDTTKVKEALMHAKEVLENQISE